ncbi:glutaredoxin-like protein [Corynebacterium yudongzhengii]|uniref:Glutaredoxin-like protein n=1 Tax=Corynebacterium yudongzhengii TaxID=2080740 RepID=A0A2U1T7R9_9CORY|nr:mycoredoxin [Corynebacterium yudongzhengii]AWB82335.1 glutaredoxin-like protein [Corynebacterium yudongzhengii]PWC02047.1 glutaredoxin-like protein [Corynebacterium yudongzhengii]
MSHVTIYATSWCPHCANLKKRLDRTEHAYDVIDVEENPEAAEWVESVNDGNRVVPTVKYSDGTYATNPAASAVRRKIAELEEA